MKDNYLPMIFLAMVFTVIYYLEFICLFFLLINQMNNIVSKLSVFLFLKLMECIFLFSVFKKKQIIFVLITPNVRYFVLFSLSPTCLLNSTDPQFFVATFFLTFCAKKLHFRNRTKHFSVWNHYIMCHHRMKWQCFYEIC